MTRLYLLFAWRYLRARKSTNAINVIAWVSVTAIVIGTAALIVILSAFNGFEGLVRTLYSEFYPDIRVIPASGKFMRLDSARLSKLSRFPGVLAASAVAEEKALLQNGEMQTIVQLKGVDPLYRAVSGVPGKIYRGRFETGTPDRPMAVVGVGVENAIGILADRSLLPVTVHLPRKGSADMSDPMASLSQGQLMPAGSFAIQTEFDNKYVFTDLEFLRRYGGLDADEYSAMEIALDDPAREGEVVEGMQALLGPGYLVQTKYEQNRTLYATIRLEKWAIFAIFSLILAVAAFNMVGALSMLVLEKRKDIGVLQSMGADRRLIRGIFLSEGMLLGAVGLAIGMLLALGLCYLQVRYKLIPLQGASFLIDYYPVRLLPGDFLLVGTTVMAIAVLASWLPAARAARQPFSLRN